jgi:hypothetical protein
MFDHHQGQSKKKKTYKFPKKIDTGHKIVPAAMRYFFFFFQVQILSS